MKNRVKIFIILSIVCILLAVIFCFSLYAQQRDTHGRQYSFAERNLNAEFDSIYYLLNKRDSIIVFNSDCIYFGDPGQNGTWKIKVSGDNLVFQKRESGEFVTKDTITP